MINVIKQTPIEYSKQSRDYQTISRLFTAIYNISKMYIDDMSIWNGDIDNKLTTLRSKTLNFIPKHSWDLNDLDAAISCFKYILRSKGTIQALEFCLTILLRMRRIDGKISEKLGTLEIKDNIIFVKIPQQLASAGVVEDLFDYLIPAGMDYRIIEYSESDLGNQNITTLVYSDEESHTTINKFNMGINDGANSSGNKATTIYKNAVQDFEHSTT